MLKKKMLKKNRRYFSPPTEKNFLHFNPLTKNITNDV